MLNLKKISVRHPSIHILPHRIKKEIQKLAHDITKIMYLGCQYLEFCWRSYYYDGKQLPTEEKTFITNSFLSIYATGHRDAQLWNSWKQAGGIGCHLKSNRSCFTQCFQQYEIKRYIDVDMENYRGTLSTHFKKMAAAEHNYQLSKPELTSLVNVVFNDEEPSKKLVQRLGEEQVEQFCNFWKPKIATSTSHFSQFILRMEFLYHIEIAERKYSRCFSRFATIPKSGYSLRFIRFDNTMLQNLPLKGKKKKCIRKSVRKKFSLINCGKLGRYWKSMEAKYHQKGITLIRHISLISDGIQLHIPLEIKIQKKIKKKKKKGDDMPKSKRPKLMVQKLFEVPNNTSILSEQENNLFTVTALEVTRNLPPVQVTSVDPGDNVVYSACVRKKYQHQEIIQHEELRRTEYAWRSNSMQTRRRCQQYFDRRGKEVRNSRKIRRGGIPLKIQQIENGLCQFSLNTYDYLKYLESLKQHMRQFQTLFLFYSSRNKARNRFYNQQRKQSTYDFISKRLAPCKKQVIAWGNGFRGRDPGFGHQYGRAPVLGVRRYLQKTNKVVLINEYYTSQKCCNCMSQLSEHRELRAVPKKLPNETMSAWKIRYKAYKGDDKIQNMYDWKIVPLRRLKYCEHCKKVVDRDCNAAGNILKIFDYEWIHHVRPPYLQLPPTDNSPLTSSSVSIQPTTSI